MTTSDTFQVALAPNLFQPNECVNLSWPGTEPRPHLAAITFMLPAKLGDVRADLIWACIREACSMIMRGSPSYCPWLCASDCGKKIALPSIARCGEGLQRVASSRLRDALRSGR
jgi:hypothetical protein